MTQKQLFKTALQTTFLALVFFRPVPLTEVIGFAIATKF